MKAKSGESISIRPGVSILSVLRHLNYRPWFAVAEFVDNSVQSYLTHKNDLKRLEGKFFKLKVEVELDTADNSYLVVRDNAAGIHRKDYARAFRAAELPPDRSGLSEFGMGMKSAACWFAPQWTVRTSALGERIERTVSFNIEKIVEDDLQELDVTTRHAHANTHFTEVSLSNLHKPPQGRTITKIKEHLASIYRVFIREGVLELKFNGEPLTFLEPRVLKAPYHKTPKGEVRLWRKEVDITLGKGLRVYGFAAIRETASTTQAGFALFRRHRLIQGSVDEGYRPESIFGKSNSFRYQRLFGELNFDNFEVSHTKDGFRWDEHEEQVLRLLKNELDKKPLPLLEQASEHRIKPSKGDLKRGAEIANQRTAETIKREIPNVLSSQLNRKPEEQPPPKALPSAGMASSREIDISLNGKSWQIALELSDDPAIGDWVTVSDSPFAPQNNGSKVGGKSRKIAVRVSLRHPFMEKFAGADPEQLEPLVRLAVAIGLSEISARERGVRQAGTIRRSINQLLRDALSK
jgi:hypothetical protein